SWMLPYSLQGLATRWLACLPGRDSHPLNYTTLPGRTLNNVPLVPSKAVLFRHCSPTSSSTIWTRSLRSVATSSFATPTTSSSS
ncbi:MAG: hypothetical protein WA140_02130, partial [Geobacteraceae bacterium]